MIEYVPKKREQPDVIWINNTWGGCIINTEGYYSKI